MKYGVSGNEMHENGTVRANKSAIPKPTGVGLDGRYKGFFWALKWQ